MHMTMNILGFSVVLIPEEGSYSSWCPELNVASQGDTVEEALANLKEAMELHLECLTPGELDELRQRHGSRLITTIEIAVPV